MFARSAGRTRAAFVGAALIALASASPAAAQGRLGGGTHVISIGFGGGVTVPVSDAKDALKNGVNGEGFLLVHLGPLPALRFNLGYQRFDYKSALELPDGHAQILSGVGAISLDLLRGPIRPYILAGIGAFNVKNVADDASGESTSKTHFGIDGGAGLALQFGRVGAFVEGKVQNVYTNDTGLISAKNIRSVPVSFGILVGL